MRHVIPVLRGLLGLILLVAGLTKLLPPDHRLLFEMAVSAHRMLSPEMVIWAGWGIPLLEIALGVLLLTGVWPRLAGTVSFLLLGLFFGVMMSAFMRGIQAYCGCFGFGEQISQWTLVRDGAFLAVALIVTVAAWRRPGAAAAYSRPTVAEQA